ncbi:MAG: SCO family protein [Pseudomonadota bacterium]
MAWNPAVIASTTAGVVVGGGLLVFSVLQPSNDLAQCIGTSVAGGDVGGPFTLVSEDGQTVTDRDVINGPTLVYFGYTFCPDVCPMDTDRMAQAMEILDEQGKGIDALFVSIDPVRDTPDYLAEFTDYFHPRLVGLSGTEEQVKAAADEYRVFYRKVETDEEDFYLMDHSTLTYLMTPDEGMVTFFRRDLAPEAMAEQVGCVVDAVGV